MGEAHILINHFSVVITMNYKRFPDAFYFTSAPATGARRLDGCIGRPVQGSVPICATDL